MTFLKIIFLDDLIDFIDFWFHHFPKRIIRSFFDFIYYIDRYFGFRANLRNLTKPLFGDFSIIGYAIAFPYRIVKIIIGGAVYFFIGLGYLIFLVLWLFLPIFLLINGIFL